MKDLIDFLNDVRCMRDKLEITDSLYRSCVSRELEGSDLDKNYLNMLRNKYLGEVADV